MLSDLEVVALLSAKFCHDLAGPVGAISNGFEYMQDSDESMRNKAYELVGTSAKQAVARLQFFRQLYGNVPQQGEANLAELRSISERFFSFGKTSLQWTDESVVVPGVVIGPQTAKLLLNVLYIAGSSLIHGGKIEVMINKIPNGKQIKIIAGGQNVKLEDEAADLLQGENKNYPTTTKNIHFYFTSLLLKQLKANIEVNKSNNELSLIITQTKDEE